MAVLFDHGISERYDWVLNAELDHFIVARQVKNYIVAHLRVLSVGTASEQKSVGEGIMLLWGNAFVFNRRLVSQMKSEWANLSRSSRPMVNLTKGNGCPNMSAGRTTCCGFCEQDMIYPVMWQSMKACFRQYGQAGCGQPDNSRSGFPISCWQPAQPLPDTVSGYKMAIQEIALMRNISGEDAAYRHCHARGGNIVKYCKKLYQAVGVPVLHNFKDPLLHVLATQLLRP